jgi:hypothetical protein
MLLFKLQDIPEIFGDLPNVLTLAKKKHETSGADEAECA